MSIPSGTSPSLFQFDICNQCLLRNSREVHLRPKTFGVLRYLVEHAGQLVTKEQLLDAVWPQCHVTDIVLAVSIWELRKIFGDDPKIPRFIRTVHRRGYRFIGRISLAPEPGVGGDRSERLGAVFNLITI